MGERSTRQGALVTLELPHPDLVTRIGKKYLKSDVWPSERPKPGDAAAGLGYPGRHLGKKGCDLFFREVPFVLTVGSVTDRHFVLAPSKKPRTYLKMNDGITDDAAFGGLSGSSVYIWSEEKQELRLGGFFYEAKDELNTLMFIAHGDFIRADGTLDWHRMPWA